MTRKDLASALRVVSEALVKCNIVRVLQNAFGREGVSYDAVLEAFQKYSRLSGTFNDNEKKLVSIFHLDELEKISFWQIIIAGDTTEYEKIHEINQRVSVLITYVSDMLKLIEPEGISFSHGNNLQSEISRGKEMLTIVLPEEGNKFSTPSRLVNAIESVELLYSVCARLDGDSENDLAIVAIDSGSDKSFDFIGAAKIVECVKETIIALWDRIVFYRERQQSERLDLVEKSLPLIERINKLEKEESLSGEQAEIFRRNVLLGIHKFASSGIIIPELNLVSSHSPRKLMAPEPKLLVENTEVDAPHKKTDVSERANKSGLNEHETKQLKDLLSKMKESE